MIDQFFEWLDRQFMKLELWLESRKSADDDQEYENYWQGDNE